jgi:hypothetical protein
MPFVKYFAVKHRSCKKIFFEVQWGKLLKKRKSPYEINESKDTAHSKEKQGKKRKNVDRILIWG